MKRNTMIKIIISAGMVLGSIILLVIFNPLQQGETLANSTQTYQDLYVCAMHPYEMSATPGSCPICNMKLSRVDGFQPGSEPPEIDRLFVSSADPMYVHLGSGTDPASGRQLIPITQSSIYTPPSDSHKEMANHIEGDGAETLWTCGMHPEVIEEEPGLCPICHMDLIPLKVRLQIVKESQ